RVFSLTPTPTPEIYTLSLHDALPICRYFRKPQSLQRSRISGAMSASPTRTSLDALVEIAQTINTLRDPEAVLEKVLEIAMETLRSEEHTSELQSRENLVCRLLLEKKK